MGRKKVACIIQARMGSSRLPGKVLKNLCGKPMIEHIYLRAKNAEMIDEVVIATTSSKEDDILCDFLEQKNIKYYRGSEEDVLGRYVAVAKRIKADVIVRITGDCPLIDNNLINNIVKMFLELDYDYMSPKSEYGLIRGLDTEIFTMDALEKANALAKDKNSREHVTLYMYRNPDKFKIGLFPIPEHLKSFEIRLCVDEEQDFNFIAEIYKDLYKRNDVINIRDVLNLLKDKPDLLKININVKQKQV